jgi:hypothetical protein
VNESVCLSTNLYTELRVLFCIIQILRPWSKSGEVVTLPGVVKIIRKGTSPLPKALTNLLPEHVTSTSAVYFRLSPRTIFVLSSSSPCPHATHHLHNIPLPLFLSSVSAHGRFILPLALPAHATRPCMECCRSSWSNNMRHIWGGV